MRRAGAWLVPLVPVLAIAAGEGDHTKSPSASARERHQRALERCETQRGVDCRTEQGLRTWLLQERTRAEAIEDGSRSIRQRVDRLEDRTPSPR